MSWTNNKFGEIYQILIYLRLWQCRTLTTPVILKLTISQWCYMCIFCADLFTNCVENSKKPGQIFNIYHYLKYPSHSADLHET
jgi:hypothetical protein